MAVKDFTAPLAYVQSDHVIIRSKKLILGEPFTLPVDDETWIILKSSKNIIDVYVKKPDSAPKAHRKANVKRTNEKVKPEPIPDQ